MKAPLMLIPRGQPVNEGQLTIDDGGKNMNTKFLPMPRGIEGYLREVR